MRLAGEKIIFVGLTTEQTHKVIDSLHQQGETIAVYGDNPADLPFMKQADLSISVKNASQAALSTANIVLLDRAPKVLENLLEEGQKTVNGLLEVLKLYLTQLAYLTFLIVILWVGGLGFPYLSQQGAFISITTLALPSLALSLTAHPGTLSKIKFSRLLSWFVIPAALAICSAGFAVYIHFLKANDTLAYAQLALTHMLVFSGLALVILVRLPTRQQTSEGGNKPDMIKAKNPIGRMQELDWRMTFIVLILLVLYLGFTTLPIASRFFSLTHLQSINDYLYVWGFVLLWITAVTIFWQFFTPKPYKPWTLHNGPFSDRVQKMDQRSY